MFKTNFQYVSGVFVCFLFPFLSLFVLFCFLFPMSLRPPHPDSWNPCDTPFKTPGTAPGCRAQIKPTRMTDRLTWLRSSSPSLPVFRGKSRHDDPLCARSVRSPEAALQPPVTAGRSRQVRLSVEHTAFWCSRSYIAVRSAPRVSVRLASAFYVILQFEDVSCCQLKAYTLPCKVMHYSETTPLRRVKTDRFISPAEKLSVVHESVFYLCCYSDADLRSVERV